MRLVRMCAIHRIRTENAVRRFYHLEGCITFGHGSDSVFAHIPQNGMYAPRGEWGVSK
jgi:hypothetical protein